MSYYCKKCGYSHNALDILVRSSCPKGGNHEPYEGRETGPFHCKKCGYSHNALDILVRSSCPKGGNHEPL